jgi:hypothetical protein
MITATPPLLYSQGNILASSYSNTTKINDRVKGNYSLWKLAVDQVLDSNVDISNYETAGSIRYLLIAQDNPVENGIYISTTNNQLMRADDMKNGTSISGSFILVLPGTLYFCSNLKPNDIIGTSEIIFSSVNLFGAAYNPVGIAGSIQFGNNDQTTNYLSGNSDYVFSFLDVVSGKNLTVYQTINVSSFLNIKSVGAGSMIQSSSNGLSRKGSIGITPSKQSFLADVGHFQASTHDKTDSSNNKVILAITGNINLSSHKRNVLINGNYVLFNGSLRFENGGITYQKNTATIATVQNVTLNSNQGIINITDCSSITANNVGTITVTNSVVTTNSLIFLTLGYPANSGNGNPVLEIYTISNGSFVISILNTNSTTGLSGSMTVSFMVY